MKTHKIYGHHLKGSVEKQNWYIGRTSLKFEKRWRKKGNGYKCQPKFYNAIKKYGWDNFEHIFIAECETEDQAILAEAIFKRIYDSVENGYNCIKGEEDKNPMLGRQHTKEAKEKNRQAHLGEKHPMYGKHQTEEHRQKISIANKGKKRSEEQKKNISNSHKGIQAGEKNPMYGKHQTEEAKGNISRANKGINKGKTWRVINGKRVWMDKDKI